MENIKFGDLYLSKEESKDIIEFLAKKRNIKANRVIDCIKYLRNKKETETEKNR